MTTIRHMFLCNKCLKIDADYNGGLCHIFNEKLDSDCPGQLQPVIFVSDLKRLINRTIDAQITLKEHYEKQGNESKVWEQIYKNEALLSILSDIDGDK